MHEAIKEWLLWVIRVPPEPLDPMGDVAALRVFRAAPGYFRYMILVWAIKQFVGLIVTLGILIVIFLGAREQGSAAGIVGGVEILAFLLFPVQAFFSFFLLRLGYEMRWYKVTDRSLRIREGVWSVHEMTMTFANIQNITVEQGPIERLFGIADVRVETAGGGGAAVPQQHGQAMGLNMHLGVFRGVDNAAEIRDLMLERLRRLAGAGLGDLDDAHHAAVTPAPIPFSPGIAFGPQSLALLASLRDEAAALRRASVRLETGRIDS